MALVRFWQHRTQRVNTQLVFGLTAVSVFVIFGFLVPLFAPVRPAAWHTVPRDLTPQAEHILGTTSLGQPVFWLLARATGNSIMIGVAVALASTVIGVSMGSLAGFVGGVVDRILTVVIDAMIAIPALPILILLASLFRGDASVLVLIVILIVFNWPWPARQVRSMVLSLRERQFVDVARFSGQSTSRIILREIVPHMLPWMAANINNTVLVAIALEAGLAVIGMAALEYPTLGTMLYWALQYQSMFRGLWWWIVPPVIATMLLFISLFLVSSGFSQLEHRRREA